MSMPTGRSTAKSGSLQHPGEQPYLARLAGAASLRRELEDLLAAASPMASTSSLRDLALKGNAIGKKSASAVRLAWERLKVRYVLDPQVPEYRAFLAAMDMSGVYEDRGLACFLMLARTDRLFREVTEECVSPLLRKEGLVIEPTQVYAAIRARVDMSGLAWSASTLASVRGHLLAALKDVGVLKGSRRKITRIPRISPAIALFAMHIGRLEGLTDRQLIDSVWFRLLGLDRERVIEILYSAARAGVLGFRMQADVVEITLPSLQEIGR